MKNSKRNRPNGWQYLPIGDLLSLEYGKSFPKKKRAPGPFAVYGSNGIVDRAHQYLLEESTIIVGRKGSAGEINIAEPQSWPIDTTYYVKLKDRRIFSLDFIYYLLKWLDPRRFIEITTKPGLNRDRVYEQVVPVPPLPVQERIVEILQKADEICHKRQEALELADRILPSLFIEMFGDPATNPKGYKKTTIGNITSLVTSGYTPRGGARNYVTDGPLLLRSQNIQMLSLDLSDCAHLPEPIFEDMERVHVRCGDVLMNITGKGTAGRVTWVDDANLRAAVNQHVCIIRCNEEKILSPFLAITLSMPHYQAIIDRAPGSTQTGFNHSRVRSLEVLVPPMPIQKSFVAQVNTLQEVRSKHLVAFQDAEYTLFGLQTHAFTGKLTAEWEAANAEWIAEQVEFHKQLPRLILLAFLRERANRAGRKAKEAAILVTAMMKYAFLLQMEGNGRRLYQFVPYHYGPFAKDLYADLEKLQEDGLVTVDKDTDEDKTRIILVDSAKADDALSVLPDDLKEDILVILNTYGNLDHNALLKTVYEKYPVYAKKSRLRQKRC